MTTSEELGFAKFNYRCPRKHWIRQVPLRKMNVYHYFHYERPENVYFPYTASNSNPSDNARFEGITPRRPPVNECMCDV